MSTNPNPQFSIDFRLSDDPLPRCDCEQMIFTNGTVVKTLTAKRHKKDKSTDRFPWEAGTIAFTILMLRFKLEYRRGTGSHDFPPAKRGTVEASAYDVIEKANWLPEGFGYKNSPGIRVFNLKLLTDPKRVSIQIDTDLLSAKSVCFYRGKNTRGLTLQQMKDLKASFTRRWQELQRPSKNTLLDKARKVTARRVRQRQTVRRRNNRALLLPPHFTWSYFFLRASIERKIQMVREDIIPLLKKCEQLTRNRDLDLHLQLLTQIAGFYFESRYDKERALPYAKRAKILGEKLGDPYAAELGQILIEELKKGNQRQNAEGNAGQANQAAPSKP